MYFKLNKLEILIQYEPLSVKRILNFFYIYNMKFIWFIFSIYLVSLSLLPCNDVDECTDFAKTELHKNHSQDKKSDTQRNDQCAPFCSCACCGVNGFQFQSHISKEEKKFSFAYTKKQPILYVFNNYKIIYLGIWQPPKLS